MIITPIGNSNFDLTGFTTAVKACLGVAPVSTLTKVNAKFLSTLVKSFTDRKDDDLSTLRESQPYLKHLHYAFLVVDHTETFYQLMATSSLEVSVVETLKQGVDLAVISGNLQQWRNFLINGSTNLEVRLLLTEILSFFEREGLGNIFSPYVKQKQQDGSYSLILRK